MSKPTLREWCIENNLGPKDRFKLVTSDSEATYEIIAIGETKVFVRSHDCLEFLWGTHTVNESHFAKVATYRQYVGRGTR